MTWIGLSVAEYYAPVRILAGKKSLNITCGDEGLP